MIQLSELVKIIIIEYIEYPQLLIIKENEEMVEADGLTTVIKVRTSNKSDTGKLIGREGKNIDALRRIVNTIASKRKIRVDLQIIS